MGRMVGERQRWVWLAAAETAVIAVELCRYNWGSVAIGSTVVTLYNLLMDRTAPETGIAAVLSGRKCMGKVLLSLSLLWFVIMLTWAAGLAGKAFSATDKSPLLGWILLGLAAWGSIKGPNACASCCGVLCLFLVVLYGVVAVFSVSDIQPEYLQLEPEPGNIIRCVGLLLTASVVWYLPSDKKQNRKMWDIAVILFTGAVLLSVITEGVLSSELASAVSVPLYAVAQSVSLFGVVERIEALLSAAMTMSIFALLSAVAGACSVVGNEICPWKYYGVFSCAAAGLLMLVEKEIDVLWMSIGTGVVCLLIPLAAIGVGRRKSNY